MIRSFCLGFIAGSLVVWFGRERIEEYLERQTRTVRSRAADRLHSVEETAERLIDRTATPLRRAEDFLDGTKARIGKTLRAGEEALRPAGQPHDTRE